MRQIVFCCCCCLLFFPPRTVGAKDPNFGSVLHALKVSHKITRRRDQIRFNPSVCIPFPVFAIRRSEQLSPSTAATSHMRAASSMISPLSRAQGKSVPSSQVGVRRLHRGLLMCSTLVSIPLHWQCVDLIAWEQVHCKEVQRQGGVVHPSGSGSGSGLGSEMC